MSGIVAIVGRPNVGKSTLFNRLTESRDAIVDEQSGVTRDRHYGICEWNGREFSVIDTGGYAVNSDDEFEVEIRKQVHLAIEEADAIIFVVDVVSGITDLDDAVGRLLRKEKKPIVLVVNKVDNSERQYDATEFYSLGLGDYFCISSINGSGTGELLDDIVKKLPPNIDQEELDIPHFAVVGRPNVGKSSLTNILLGKERNIVTPISGTTRDSISSRYTKFGKDIMFVDTAGLRKKGKIHEDLEFYSVMRTIRTLEKADVCILLIDAVNGIEAQDMNIFDLIIRNNKGVVICVNKWDLVEKETNTARDFANKILEKIAPFNDVPIIFTSVHEKQRIMKVLEAAIEVYENRTRRIKTAKLNEFLQETIASYPPPAYKGKFIKIKYVTQLPTKFPAFAFFCNNGKYVRAPYKRYLENRIRELFNFKGVPIKIYMRDK